jgi:hypothetical protein
MCKLPQKMNSLKVAKNVLKKFKHKSLKLAIFTSFNDLS